MIVAEPQEADKHAGLECPTCGCPESRVYYTRRRTLKVNGQIVGCVLRVRICQNCGREFSTRERVQG